MADASVREARVGEGGDLARIQRAAWGRAGSGLPAAVLDRLVADDVVSMWARSIEAPPTPGHHVLVAAEQTWLVGFAAFGPAEIERPAPGDGDLEPAGPRHSGPTAEIATLLVEPRFARRGHGSRLLAATVDLARVDGVTRLITWVPEDDPSATSFFTSAGWAEAGLIRTLDADGTPLREICLHTHLDDPSTDDDDEQL